ncbi:hypothetical protein WOC12_23395 [Vibrio parahaemolyticus]|uniref:hypothetical protein n=1 Tax=Vibrio parahaemolyticus TaxID=670 RepID=UPI00081C1963|nr:hypothetical protein [Vibrio parahaemolyticus]EIO4084112.1 hypothetical protein [Vibrio parahaemolyticus]EJC1449743.1 hypothetical protein [Vibrio parahaemolyticus]EJE4210465.1 hypothetical protein [Vibrio parahaemolyticus]MDF4259447.1 hypothetical protein [Vibrio parahaemolyticus]MDF4264584.1 hypothetical protein [Vibrio parahaemolyticus]
MKIELFKKQMEHQNSQFPHVRFKIQGQAGIHRIEYKRDGSHYEHVKFRGLEFAGYYIRTDKDGNKCPELPNKKTYLVPVFEPQI